MICDFYHEKQQYQENLLTKYYIKYGHEVIIVASTFISVFDYYSGIYRRKTESSSYKIDGYKIIRVPYSINFLNRLRRLKNLRKIITIENPDMIYVHGMPLNLLDAVWYKKQHGSCWLVYDSHADYSNSASNWVSLNILHKVIYKELLKSALKHIDKIYYVTPDGGIFFEEVYKIPKKYLSLLPLGADTDYINAIDAIEVRKVIRKKLGIGIDDFVIFSGGKINREKRIDLVIDSFNLLNQNSTHLIIVGDTKDLIYKNEIISSICSNQRIHFIGWVDGFEVYDYMLSCDVALFPASQSVLWQQSIGVGLPLIVGQHLGQDASYLNINDNVILIESRFLTKEEISQQIFKLQNNISFLRDMQKNAKKTAEEYLSYNKISKITLKQKNG